MQFGLATARLAAGDASHVVADARGSGSSARIGRVIRGRFATPGGASRTTPPAHRLAAAIAVLLLAAAAALQASFPSAAGTTIRADEPVRFAVIGDSGTGKAPQYEVARQMVAARASFPFELVLMAGDNLYGRQRPTDFAEKFERPYAALLGAGVRFYAALGNHDDPANRFYPPFNLGGSRYHTFVRGPVRFFVLDSNQMDGPQQRWLETELQRAGEPWKVALFHHPLYSNARRHGPDVQLRAALEPLFVRHGVRVVFAGHEHVYERHTPQHGIVHFIVGSSGQLRRGGVQPGATTAAYHDRDRAFMLVEVKGDAMTFKTITRTGMTVDAGTVTRR